MSPTFFPTPADFRRWVFTALARQALPALLVTHDAQDTPAGGRCLHMGLWQ